MTSHTQTPSLEQTVPTNPHTIYDIRRENLARVLEHRGAKTALAAKLGSTQANISHYLRKTGQFARIIHEDTARAIENALGLGPGYLDRPQGVAPPSTPISPPISPPSSSPLDEALLKHTVAVVLTKVQESGASLDAQHLSDLVVLAYEHAHAAGRLEAAYVSALVRLATKG